MSSPGNPDSEPDLLELGSPFGSTRQPDIACPALNLADLFGSRLVGLFVEPQKVALHLPLSLIQQVLGTAQQRQLELLGKAFYLAVYHDEPLSDDFVQPPGVARVVAMRERKDKETMRLQPSEYDIHVVVITDRAFLPLADEGAFAAVLCFHPPEGALGCERYLKVGHGSEARTLVTLLAMARLLAKTGVDVTGYDNVVASLANLEMEEESSASESDSADGDVA